ncbi:nucleotide exchange factor GrpE [Methylocella sp.]|uniref:nucleotide exchange factor GrpE n=1 Tax=Methylocella sp. TaxID=1978226 RepID=UPI003784C23D
MNDFKNADDSADAGRSDAETAAAAKEQDPFVVLEALKTENEGLKDRLLRTLADMENLRRRTEKEVADAKSYGVANFAREMLTVADNLTRALASVPAEARAGAEGAFKTLMEGLELTERDLASRLERFSVKKIDPAGQKFDPNLHEALFEQPNESLPSGTVTQVVEPGYVIGERVLRPAKVGVSRGGPRA